MKDVKKIYKIYVHINKINKKMYIGQTCYKNVNMRWRAGNGYSHSSHFKNSINKYGWDNFEHIILFDNIEDYRMADIIESELIKKYNTTNNKYGYNMSSGGSNNRTLSDETRNKIRETKIGSKNPNYNKPPSEETRKKMSDARKGTKQTEEWINKRKRSGEKNGMYGKKHTKETIEILRFKSSGRNNRSAKKCFLFSNIDDLCEFECLTYAYKSINKGISYCRHHRLSGIYDESNNRNIFILTEEEWARFLAYCKENNLQINTIQRRYDAYNKFFYEYEGHNKELN